uniref:endoplasmic reticulum membrane sensor NFE2L1-like isoform X2 n=1 Tax=Myxine glutinosa TaxID=7769 RepID=UPI00358DDF67
MEPLKKYFTEGLIQLTIILSLLRVDLDTYLDSGLGDLPELQEIMVGPGSTSVRIPGLRISAIDGLAVHPKIPDLDGFFAARRLASELYCPGHLRTHISAWLFHGPATSGGTDSGSATSSSHQGPPLVNSAHAGPEQTPETGRAGPADAQGCPDGSRSEDEVPVEGGARGELGGDFNKEDVDLSASFEVSRPVLASEAPAERRNANLLGIRHETQDAVGEIFPTLQEQGNDSHEPRSASTPADDSVDMSLEEYLQLLDGDVGLAPPSQVASESTPCMQGQLEENVHPEVISNGSSVAGAWGNEMLELESRWQELLSLSELEGLDTAVFSDMVQARNQLTPAGSSGCGEGRPAITSSLFEPSLPPALEAAGCISPVDLSEDALGRLIDPTFLDELGLLEHSEPGDSGVSSASPMSCDGGSYNARVVDVLRSTIRHNGEIDSDSGLSLDSASPRALSPGTCGSSAGPLSMSDGESMMAEWESDMEDEEDDNYDDNSDLGELTDDTEKGAVGGYLPEHSKMCRMDARSPDPFTVPDYLDQIGHDHNYPLRSARHPLQCDWTAQMSGRAVRREYLRRLEGQLSRDDQRARALKIPFPNRKIVNLPVEEFNTLLGGHRLSETQMALIRDIRRRGKNKVAAQNCRKRKLDTLLTLERELAILRRRKVKLLAEKMQQTRAIQSTRRKVEELSRYVLGALQHEATGGAGGPPPPPPPSFGSLQDWRGEASERIPLEEGGAASHDVGQNGKKRKQKGKKE